MRVYDQGSFVRVTVSEREVYDFMRQFPCSGLPDNTNASFTFDKRNGDLVDLQPYEMDGDGVLALAQDAQNYAATKLGIEALRR